MMDEDRVMKALYEVAAFLSGLGRNATLRLGGGDDWPEDDFQRVRAVVEDLLWPDVPGVTPDRGLFSPTISSRVRTEGSLVGAKYKYDILRETFCIYCQRDFTSPKRLQNHVLGQHPQTYASTAIEQALQESGSRVP